MDEGAYDVLSTLVPLSSEALAENLTEEQLEAVKEVIVERIRLLDRNSSDVQNTTPDAAELAEQHQPQPITTIQETSKPTKKKSRWDSDSETEDVEQQQLHKRTRKQPHKRKAPTRSLSSTPCRSLASYHREVVLSEGTYGIVWRGKDSDTGEVVAIKQIKFGNRASKDGFPLAALREANILLGLKHPNIVHAREMVIDVAQDEDEYSDGEDGYPPFRVFMVMDFYPSDLRCIMKEHMDRLFHQSEVKCLMMQLFEALHYLHERWYMHRDIKPQNLLYGAGGRLVLCDFGLARKFDDPPGNYTSMVCTLHYRSPELLLDVVDYDGRAVDMWSAGCVFAELISGAVLFSGQTEPETLNLIWHTLGTPVNGSDPLTRSWPAFEHIMDKKGIAVREQPLRRLREKIPAFSPVTQSPYLTDVGLDLLEQLLTLDPAKRIRSEEALSHDWFQKELPKSKPVGELPEFAVRM